ncbi:YetF domain-containing protein, partial [Bacillus velezensis]
MFTVFWKSVVMIAVGTFLLRIAGRKSISQLSVTQTVIMISIGSIIIQPFIEHNLWETIFAAAIFIAVLILMEYLEIKSSFFEFLFSGKTVAVVRNGKIIPENLKKMRFTESQLSMRIRQEGLGDIQDFKYVLLEPNGQIGYEL